MKKVSYLQKKKLTFLFYINIDNINLSPPWEITPAQHDHLHCHPL